MENLIPVLVILAVIGFIAFKNKDKILEIADRFKKPDPQVRADAKAQILDAYKNPDNIQRLFNRDGAFGGSQWVLTDVGDTTSWEPKPESGSIAPETGLQKPLKVEQSEQEKFDQAQAVIRRMTGASDETDKVLDERYKAYQAGREATYDAKAMQRWDDQFPTSVPTLAVPNVASRRHVVKLDKGGIKFPVVIPDAWNFLRLSTDVTLWSGKFGRNPASFVMRDNAGNVVFENHTPLEGNVGQFSPVERKGYTKLEKGTYEVEIAYTGSAYPFVETYIEVSAG